MKKRVFNFFVLLMFCNSCNTEGHRGVSRSISDSKDRDTFLGSYHVFASDEKVNSYMLSDIKEVFVEKSWFVGKPVTALDSSYFNVIVITNGKSIFFENYVVGHSYQNYFTYTNKNTLVFRIDRIQLTEPLVFHAYERDSVNKVADVYMVKR